MEDGVSRYSLFIFQKKLDPATTFSVSNLCEISLDKQLEKFKNSPPLLLPPHLFFLIS